MFGANPFGWAYLGQRYAGTTSASGTKEGHAIAGLVGSGVSASVSVDVGHGVAGLVGSGASTWVPAPPDVSWSYDGAGTLIATLTGTTPGNTYWMYAPQAGSTVTDTAVGTSLTLTATDIGPLTTGAQFDAYVITNSPEKTVFDSNIFVYGTASTTGVGFPVTWTYDGASTVTASFSASTTDSYSLDGLFYGAGGSIFEEGSSSSTGPGTVNLTLTTSQPPNSGKFFTVILYDEFGASFFDWRAVSTRMFVGGTASSGFAGSPTTGGTDVGFVGEAGPDPDTTFAGPVRVSIAFDDPTLEPDPTWTHLTDTASLVASYDIRRGRQFEFDKPDTPTATIRVNDQHGVLDPTNSTGPYYTLLEPLKQVRIQLWNPVAEEYQTRFQGFIDEMNYVVEPYTHPGLTEQEGLTRLELECVGPFAILTAIEMQPGEFGDTPPAESEGNVFFDNAEVDDRMIQVLGNAGWPVEKQVIFSGNVSMKESVYSPSENVLQVLQDAADAEFPGLGVVYEDRFGRVVFHGRLARFDPVTVAAGAGPDAWDFHAWKVGDEEAFNGDADVAQVRAFAFNRGTDKIINSALATPNRPELELTAAEYAGQYVKDTVSIGIYGYRSWSAENLFTDGGLDDGLDDLEETLLFATYYVDNYAEPRNRVTELTLRSVDPDDPRAPSVWELLSKIDISDTVAITVKHPGSGGFNAEPGFVEGLTEEAVPLNGEYADVTLSIDWSPAAYFNVPLGGGG